MTFEEKVTSMKASEIIMAMVTALTHPPIINIDMSTYGICKVQFKTYLWGLIKTKKKICFGCAATNTLCQISGITFNDERIENLDERARVVGSNRRFLNSFESAINELRQGDAYNYNYYARHHNIPLIRFIFRDGYNKFLKSSYTNKDLEPYIHLAQKQKLFEDTGNVEDDDIVALNKYV